MAIRQYIGARYVPRFMGTYDETQIYEALDVVDNGHGTSYIAKVPTPAGTPLTDNTYWSIYGASSGAVIQLQNQIDAINQNLGEISELETPIATSIVNSINSLYDTFKSVIVTPEMFGAAGDGVTDDTEAIQAALDAGITFFNGTYLITHILNVSQSIYGNNATIINEADGTDARVTFFVPSTVNNIVISGINVDSRQNMPIEPTFEHSHAFRVEGDNIIIDNCSAKDIRGDGLCLNAGAHNIIVNNFTSTNALRCAISLVSCHDVILNHCDLHNTTSNYVYCVDIEPDYGRYKKVYNVVFNSCKIVDENKNAVRLVPDSAVSDDTIYNITFNDCYIRSVTGFAISSTGYGSTNMGDITIKNCELISAQQTPFDIYSRKVIRIDSCKMTSSGNGYTTYGLHGDVDCFITNNKFIGQARMTFNTYGYFVFENNDVYLKFPANTSFSDWDTNGVVNCRNHMTVIKNNRIYGTRGGIRIDTNQIKELIIRDNSIECDTNETNTCGIVVLDASSVKTINALIIAGNSFKNTTRNVVGGTKINPCIRQADWYGLRVFYGASIPSSDSAVSNLTFKKGDIFINSEPSSSGYIGWVCTTAGTPGTWRRFGAILSS